jgi:hypothetical protein
MMVAEDWSTPWPVRSVTAILSVPLAELIAKAIMTGMGKNRQRIFMHQVQLESSVLGDWMMRFLLT